MTSNKRKYRDIKENKLNNKCKGAKTTLSSSEMFIECANSIIENVSNSLNVSNEVIKLKGHLKDHLAVEVKIVEQNIALSLIKELLSSLSSELEKVTSEDSSIGHAHLEETLATVLCMVLLMSMPSNEGTWDEEMLEGVVEAVKMCVERGETKNNTKKTKVLTNKEAAKRVVGLLGEVLEGIVVLVEDQVVPEMALHKLIRSSFLLLSCKGTPVQQVVKLIALLYSKYQGARDRVVEETLAHISFRSSNHTMTHYALQGGGKIHVVTALVVLILQNHLPSLQSILHSSPSKEPLKSPSKTSSKPPRVINKAALKSGPEGGRKRKKVHYTEEEEDEDGNEEEGEDTGGLMGKCNAAYQQSSALACVFVTRMFAICHGEESDDNKECRQLLWAFLSDLQLLSTHPSFPSSQLIILSLPNILMGLMRSKKNAMQAALKSLALDCLSHSSAHFHHINMAASSSHTDLPHTTTSNFDLSHNTTSNSSTNNSRAPHRKSRYGALLYQAEPELKSSLHAHKFKQLSVEALRGVVLEGVHEDGVSKASTFWLHHWAHMDSLMHPKAPPHHFFKALLPLFQQPRALDRSAEEAQYAGTLLMHLTWSPRLYKAVVNIILMAVEDSTVTLRSKALHCLKQIFHNDPALLRRTATLAHIKRRFLDSSTMVRGAVVELVAAQAISCTSLMNAYYSLLKDRVMDVGVSVRKQVVHLFKDFVVRYSDDAGVVEMVDDMMVCLARKMNGDDELKNAILDAFNHSLIHNHHDRNLTIFSTIHGSSSLDCLFSSLLSQTNTHIHTNVREMVDYCMSLLSLFINNNIATTTPCNNNIATTTPCNNNNTKRNTLNKSKSTLNNNSKQSATSTLNIAAYIVVLKTLADVDCVLLQKHSMLLLQVLNSTTLSSLEANGISLYNIAYICNKLICLGDATGEGVDGEMDKKIDEEMSEEIDEKMDGRVMDGRVMEGGVMEGGVMEGGVMEECIVDELKVTLMRLIHSRSLKLMDKGVELMVNLAHASLIPSTHVHHLFNSVLDVFNGMDVERMEEEWSRRGGEVVGAMHVVAMLCKYHTADSGKAPTGFKIDKELVYERLMAFVTSNNPTISLNALLSLSFFFESPDAPSLDGRLVQFMFLKLSSPMLTPTIPPSTTTTPPSTTPPSTTTTPPSTTPPSTTCMISHYILKILFHYFRKQEAPITDVADKFTLKDFKEAHINSEVSVLSQRFLAPILSHLLHHSPSNRLLSIHTISSLLRQALVHPALCLPQLIAASSYEDGSSNNDVIRQHCNAWLASIHVKYPSFISVCAMKGVKLAYQLHLSMRQSDTLSSTNTPSTSPTKSTVLPPLLARGHSPATCTSSLQLLYTLLRTNKAYRHSFVLSIFKMFHESRETSELLFIADNLATFPYTGLSEVLFVLQQADVVLSHAGASAYQAFRQLLTNAKLDKKDSRKKCTKKSKTELKDDDDDLDDKTLKEGITCVYATCREEILRVFHSCQTTILLIQLRQHLKHTYAFSEINIEEYCVEKKCKERGVGGRQVPVFEPTNTINYLTRQTDQKAIENAIVLMRDFFNRDS